MPRRGVGHTGPADDEEGEDGDEEMKMHIQFIVDLPILFGVTPVRH